MNARELDDDSPPTAWKIIGLFGETASCVLVTGLMRYWAASDPLSRDLGRSGGDARRCGGLVPSCAPRGGPWCRLLPASAGSS